MSPQEHMNTHIQLRMRCSGALSLARFNVASRWLLGFLAAASLTSGADWPQFMGPNGDGTSTEKGLARTWPVDGPKVLWTVSVGPGYGGAAVREGKVYLLDRVDRKRDVLRVLDLTTGTE